MTLQGGFSLGKVRKNNFYFFSSSLNAVVFWFCSHLIFLDPRYVTSEKSGFFSNLKEDRCDHRVTELYLTKNSFLKFCFISYSLLPPRYGTWTSDDRYFLVLNEVLSNLCILFLKASVVGRKFSRYSHWRGCVLFLRHRNFSGTWCVSQQL